MENIDVWKIIPGLESYCINRFGTVKALPKIREGRLDNLNHHANTTKKSQRHYKEKIIKSSIKSNYVYVSLNHNNIKKDYRVHRLVYLTFVGDIPEGMVIDHIDGNKLNNNVNNLRCVTASENCRNPNTKYKRSKSIIQINPETLEIINEFKNTTDAMIALGYKYRPGMSNHIGDCCKGKRKSTLGYYWKYKDELK